MEEEPFQRRNQEQQQPVLELISCLKDDVSLTITCFVFWLNMPSMIHSFIQGFI